MSRFCTICLEEVFYTKETFLEALEICQKHDKEKHDIESTDSEKLSRLQSRGHSPDGNSTN